MVQSVAVLCADPAHAESVADLRAAMRIHPNTLNEPASVLRTRAAAQSGSNNKLD
jgi:hypothetical protein